MDLLSVLSAAQSPDLAIRSQAENHLNQALEQQYAPFLAALSAAFVDESQPDNNRHMVGLYIKNIMFANNMNSRIEKQKKWLKCDAATKDQIRHYFLVGLQSSIPVVSRTAAQIVAAFGSHDMSKKPSHWPSLLPTIFQLVTNPSTSDASKRACLDALGYICDDMDPEELEAGEVNQILSTIVDGMRPDRANEIRLAATSALNLALDFADENFKRQVERDAIMQTIFSATQCTSDWQIRAKAFECCTSVVEQYYDHMAPYISHMFTLTTTAIQQDREEVAMQALEFWCTICDVEMEKIEEIENQDDEQREPHVYLKITEQAAPLLVPIVLELLTKQKQDYSDPESEQDIHSRAQITLQQFSNTIKEAILPHTLPFVTSNFSSSEWRRRDAAVFAFGTILEGPSPESLRAIVMQALPPLIPFLQDPINLVRDTSTWTIGRIFQYHRDSISPELIPTVVGALAQTLDDASSSVCSQACFALNCMAESCEEDSENPTNLLSPYMPTLLQRLFVAANRPDDSADNNLAASAYECAISMVAYCASDMIPVVKQVCIECMNRLDVAMSGAGGEEKRGLQSYLCTLIGNCIKRLDMAELTSISDQIMTLLLRVLTVKNTSAHYDAIISIGHAAEGLEENFEKYLPFVMPHILTSFSQAEESSELVIISMGTMSDVSRSVGKAIVPYCNDLMQCILQLLQSSVVDQSVKPHAMGLIADIAMAMEGDFEPYLPFTMQFMQQAGQTAVVIADPDDGDQVDFINSLRSGILEAYTGVLQGMVSSGKQMSLAPYAEGVFSFFNSLAVVDDKTDDVLKEMVGLIGDIGQTFGTHSKNFLSNAHVSGVLDEAQGDEDIDQSVVSWARKIRKEICGM